MNIGKTLKSLRKHKGVTQRAVADFLNMDRSAYSRIEENKTKLTIVLWFKLATFYDMELGYFVKLFS